MLTERSQYKQLNLCTKYFPENFLPIITYFKQTQTIYIMMKEPTRYRTLAKIDILENILLRNNQYRIERICRLIIRCVAFHCRDLLIFNSIDRGDR